MRERSVAMSSTFEPGQHLIGRLIGAPPALGRMLRATCVVLVVGLGLVGLATAIRSLSPDRVYGKDVLALHVLARAILDGSDWTLPIDRLAERQIGPLPHAVFAHPTPHPPTLGVLALPLALLDYQVAAALWLGLGIIALGLSGYLLLRATGAAIPTRWMPVALAAMFAWYPAVLDLGLGNMNAVLLLLLAGAWQARQSRRPLLAGLLLGGTLLVKPVAWPVLLLLAIRRDWPAVTASALTLLAGALVTGWLVGLGSLATYATRMLPAISALYQDAGGNLSLWTIGGRLFRGTTLATDAATVIAVPPLFSSESLARATAVAIPLLALLIAGVAVARLRCLDWSFGLMTCVSIIINPIAWPYYLTLALLPLALVWRWLAVRRFPARETNLALLATIPLLLPYEAWARLALGIAGVWPAPAVLSVAALVTLGPTLAVVGLGGLTAWLGTRTAVMHDA